MLSSNALCTREDVLAWIVKTSDSNANIDDNVDAIINGISTAFETYCNRTFASTEHTEYFDGKGSDILVPKNNPITTVSGIWDSINWNWSDATEVSSTYYRIVNSNYIVLNNTYFLDGRQNVKITYTAGYSTIPNDLKHACIRECVREYQKLHSKNVGMTGRSERDTSTSYSEDDFLPLTKTILNMYRKKVVR